MTPAKAFIDKLSNGGFRIVAGVPCSSLGGLIDAATDCSALRYVSASNEGEAVAIAAGAWLGGARGAVFLQNSGLGNAVSPLTSLVDTFGIPLLMIVGWRGQPGSDDEPQHRLMGELTPEILRLCRFEVAPIDTVDIGKWHGTPQQDRNLGLALLVTGGGYRSDGRKSDQPRRTRSSSERRDFCRGERKTTRAEFIDMVVAAVDSLTAVFSTTGMSSRELFELGDRPNHLYQVGSMGCVSSVALGFALASGRRTVVLDGDGAALMRLGALATIGSEQPANLLHIMLDNGVHDSTGGQPTATDVTDLAAVAEACGYARVAVCDDRSGMDRALEWASTQALPVFVHARIGGWSEAVAGRPTVLPRDVAIRFRRHFEVN